MGNIPITRTQLTPLDQLNLPNSVNDSTDNLSLTMVNRGNATANSASSLFLRKVNRSNSLLFKEFKLREPDGRLCMQVVSLYGSLIVATRRPILFTTQYSSYVREPNYHSQPVNVSVSSVLLYRFIEGVSPGPDGQ